MNGIEVVDRRGEWDGPVPEPTGVATQFWDATGDGRFLLQECPVCERVQFYPRVICTDCGHEDPGWTEAIGRGEVYTYTVCHTAREQAFRELVPYAVALVDLAEGPRMTALIPGDVEDVAVGTPVEMRLWQVADSAALPVFFPE